MINLNSDLAEGAGHDEEILARIDSANVCCGVHAGSLSETKAAILGVPRTGRPVPS